MDIAETRTRIADDATQLVGRTPLVRLSEFAPNLVAKIESFNPMSSIKDRVAVKMLDEAADAGSIDADTTIIEPTSGNTGIGLAFACAARDYDLVLTMPESMTEERRAMLRALGADLELTTSDEGMNGAIDRAEQIAEERSNTYVPLQFENPANPRAHRESTGPEIWEATGGEADVFVAAVGTGGTITGVSEYFKEDREKHTFEAIAVEPAESAVLSGEEAGSHGIAGMGAGFIPDVLRTDLLDEIVTIVTEDARETTRELAKTEGILTGISAGAAVLAATEVAKRPEHEDDLVVTVLPDTGERYLSTDLFDET